MPACAGIRHLNDVVPVLDARPEPIPELREGFPKPLNVPSGDLAIGDILQRKSEGNRPLASSRYIV